MTATTRPFESADLVAAHGITAAFGWPHRLEDWTFMARHAQGVVLEQDGVVLGTAMAWLYGPDHAGLGLVGVRPDQQGSGFGRRLMQALLDALGHRTVVLVATAAGAPLYESLGFVRATTVRQYQGVASCNGLVQLPEGQRLRSIGRGDHDAVHALDTAAHGFPRGAMLAELLEAPGGVMLDVGDTPAGFCLQRRFGRGQLIGPAAARDKVGAQALIGHLVAQQAGQFVRVDVPDASGLGPWLMGFSLADAGPGLRMVRGPTPTIGQGGVHMQAMASQALG